MLVAEYNIGLMTVRLAFLVKYVEQCSVKLGFVDIDASFVFHAMMDVGITMPRLLDVYDQLFKSRVSACLCVSTCVSVSTCVCVYVCRLTCVTVCMIYNVLLGFKTKSVKQRCHNLLGSQPTVYK